MMKWNGMGVEEATQRFRRQAGRLVSNSDIQGLKDLFCTVTAAACMQDGDEAMERMADQLQQAINEPNQRIRRNRFPRF